jgi:hypothetical protein
MNMHMVTPKMYIYTLKKIYLFGNISDECQCLLLCICKWQPIQDFTEINKQNVRYTYATQDAIIYRLETRHTWNSYEDIDTKSYWSSEIMYVLLLYIVTDVTICKKLILIHIIVYIINFSVLWICTIIYWHLLVINTTAVLGT